MKLRYALYDSSTERFLSGDLYRSGSEAADQRDPRCTDVYVVPVSVPGNDPLDDPPSDPHKFACDVADIVVSFDECAAPRDLDVPGQWQTYAVTYTDVSLDDEDNEAVLLFQARSAQHAIEQCDNVSDDYLVVDVARIHDPVQQFEVVSYDNDQRQWFYDIITARSAEDAKSVVCSRRPYVIDADAQELDATIESLVGHSPRYHDCIPFRQSGGTQ